ncbi:MAG: tRNA (adenosine(37)-N6)-dimethylallyltransferase MiaA [Chitinophagaceae bacterium]|nr:tRNA (adenosine(37)-N6)-dimethylallyltransferase MiaA [Chitinophagaceae bacterium]MCW5905910.1 tRNA (adenosine(37)-N6)-dimethylallyltransferase MiaA [Chitinophagaceae bacterium]
MLQKNTVIIIVGPTAVGKTALAIQVAQHFHTKIISADSRQCFKELTIGVAKPSVDELQQVEHFFINSHAIHQNINAATFENYALEKVNDIFKHQPIAVMVGGTGLYIKAFCEGLDLIPDIPKNIRDVLITQYNEKGLEWLQQQVKGKDAAFWKIAEQQNPQRLMRALEVITFTGKSITTFRKGTQLQRPFNIVKIGLELEREELYDSINKRVDVMMQNGLLDEVKQLLPYEQLNALQSVGYKELFDYLHNKYSLQEAINEIKKNTRHYAKRQLTWFKKDDTIQWFQPQQTKEILQFINSSFL